jgi:2-(1,2-epoxy-1,2-dihydrophenyl)acetyl-CoA isomerase
MTASTSIGGRRVELTVDRGVGQLRLIRPEARNAIDPAWVLALREAVEECAGRTDVRAVLVSAEGPSFSVGGDLDHFAAHLDALPEELESMISGFHVALRTLAELSVPVVCAAAGAVAGGGIGLLWCADVVLLADDAKLATGFSRLGLSGDGGSSWYLPRLVGTLRATEMILEGRVLSATEALEWGLVSRVVPRDGLEQQAADLAQRLASGPTYAYGEMRALIRRALDVPLAEGLDAEREAIVRCGATADGREGITAFAERRSPRFSGR